MKIALMIDGGYLRASAKKAKKKYDNTFIEEFSKKCVEAGEYLLRVLYYDSPQYRGAAQLPVSGKATNFSASDQWLIELAKRPRFAVRRGTIGFRGWKPKKTPIKITGPLADSDFSPVFEQKGVDMRVGLDIAGMSEKKSVDRIVMVTGDTDMIPALKHARKSGLEIVLIQLPRPTRDLHVGLQEHSDLVRSVKWP